jgi:APA family basic amino acid/polyamine antiporter
MQEQLPRKLGPWVCISIVAGSVIGSSIFMKPSTMAGQLGSPLMLVLVWIIAGGVSLCGAMINAEIGAMLPETGGQYAWFRHMYGKFFAWLYGWACFIVINTASIAAIAFIAAAYAGYFIPLPHFSSAVEHSMGLRIPVVGTFYPLENAGVKGLAILFILLFTIINQRSVRAGGSIQVVFTVVKVATLVFLSACLLFSGKGEVIHLFQNSPDFDPSFSTVVAGSVAAASGALAAYDGWNNLGFAAGEIRDPQKNIPRGLILGLGICILLYLLTTVAYLYILPVDVMKHSPLVATDALSIAVGPAGAAIIAALVIISALGATNGNILPCARVTYAMAGDGLFFASAGRTGKRFRTPYAALWMQCIVSCLFLLTGSFDMLADLFVFVSWIFYGFGAAGLLVLRKKMRNRHRPFRLKYAWLLTILFVSFTLLYFIITMYSDIKNYVEGKSPMIHSAFGCILLLAGIPLYLYFRKQRNEVELLQQEKIEDPAGQPVA